MLQGSERQTVGEILARRPSRSRVDTLASRRALGQPSPTKAENQYAILSIEETAKGRDASLS